MTNSTPAEQTVARLISQSVNRHSPDGMFADPGQEPGTLVIEIDGRQFRITVEEIQ